MAAVAALLGAVLIITILWEGFELMVLPRRVTRPFRLTSLSFRLFWSTWRAVGRLLSPARREPWLGLYGPLSLLLGLVVWAAGISLGFALLHWAAGSVVSATGARPGFLSDLYFSGGDFFSGAPSEFAPAAGWGRLFAVAEAALGFVFLALIISYFPPLNQSFARREVSISLLDARAGSPPSAVEMLRRHRNAHGVESLRELLLEWERWAAELLESHQSYPVLAYFRSQHDNQSWLGALTAILDTCTLVMVGIEGACRRQAELTFAVARHAVVDLCLVFRRPPTPLAQDRLPPETWAAARARLAEVGVKLRDDAAAGPALAELRLLYEPYVTALARHFALDLPPWMPPEPRRDDWEVSEWEGRAARAPRPLPGGSARASS